MAPKDISMRLEVLTIQELLQSIDTHRIVLNDNKILQYNCKNSSYFIESTFLNMPMMPIVMDGRHIYWNVIDGTKRLCILHKFKSDSLVWQVSKFVGDVNLPKKYTELTPFMKFRFLNTKIPCYIINPGTPYLVAKEIESRYKTNLL